MADTIEKLAAALGGESIQEATEPAVKAAPPPPADADASPADAEPDAEIESGGGEEPESTPEGEEGAGSKALYEPGGRLAAEAARAGLDYEEACSFGSDEGLRAHLRLAAARKDRGKPQDEAAGKVEEYKPFQMPDLAALELSDDVQGLLKGMVEHYDNAMKAVIASSKARVGTLEKALISQAKMSFDDQFDQAVNGLGDDWREAFGTGSFDELPEANQKARQALHDEVTDAFDRAKAKGEALNMRGALKRSLAALYADKLRNQTLKTAAEKSKQRAKSPRPLDRSGVPVKGETLEDRGVAEIAEAQKKLRVAASR